MHRMTSDAPMSSLPVTGCHLEGKTSPYPLLSKESQVEEAKGLARRQPWKTWHPILCQSGDAPQEWTGEALQKNKAQSAILRLTLRRPEREGMQRYRQW